MGRHLSVFALALIFTPAAILAAENFSDDDFVEVVEPGAPRVAYALRHETNTLVVVLEVMDIASAAPSGVRIGLAAARTAIKDEGNATISRVENGARYLFRIPSRELIDAEAEWSKLRMGLAVRWPGGPGDVDRLCERFLHKDHRAPHAPLSEAPQDWQPLDLREYENLVADRKARIAVTFEQPMDGKATVVIEDKQGRRIRNLLSGATRTQGRHTITWDGLDDDGELVRAGEYVWRSLHHPGLKPEYLLSFANGGETFTEPFGSNHMHFLAATTNGQQVFFAAPMTEGGYAMICLDRQGRFLRGYNPLHGAGMNAVAIAADEKYLYAAHDGEAWGQHIKKDQSDWKATVCITLSRFEIETGRIVDYPGGKRFALVEEHEWGPGAEKPALRQGLSLGGMTLMNGKIFLASRKADAILIIETADAKIVGQIPLPAPGALANNKETLFAASAGGVVKIDPSSGKTTPLLPPDHLEPQGIAVDDRGNLYVSDGRSHTVHILGANNAKPRAIGKPGGEYLGAYDAERMVRPRGIAVAGDRLWVAEDRRNPKRALAWDLQTGKVVVEKFGNPPYGSPNAGCDAQDPSHWIGLGCRWRLDFAKRTAQPLSILGGTWEQIHYRFYRREGRTFLIGLGGVTFISELRNDGTLCDLAMIGSTHRYCFQLHWQPPAAFVEAFNAAYPDRIGKHAEKGPGVLWVDINGDGLPQANEYDFSTAAEDFAGGYWGHDFCDLVLRLPARVKGRTVLVTLAPDGFHPSGAPRYPRLNDACAAGVPIDLAGCQVETACDRFGNLICNSDPTMKCFAPDGRLLWRYPNRWTNVHGSHQAPLPETGVLQGSLFFLGFGRLDDRSDIFILNGNHGRFFALTTDGLYVDEMFKDVRLGGSRDAFWIGGECFGGYFLRCEKDGGYYLQTGGDGYRIFRIHGIAELTRRQGIINVTEAQIAAAERNRIRRLAEAHKSQQVIIRRMARPPAIDGKDDDWPAEATIAWDRNGRFPVKVRVAFDDLCLYLYYHVADDSPWLNSGKDWTLLFKTGDSIDLQLGLDMQAPADRRSPVPGDIRLLMAPFGEKPLAVLYRHRVPGAKQPMVFTCPWRSETVDEVRKLEEVQIATTTALDHYTVETAIPLATLGIKTLQGAKIKGDFGVIYSDADGTVNVLRSYWANPATGLVNDVPGEIMLTPNLWGWLAFE